jgi:hypothetical protein
VRVILAVNGSNQMAELIWVDVDVVSCRGVNALYRSKMGGFTIEHIMGT